MRPSLLTFTQCTGLRKNAGFMLPFVKSFIHGPAAAAALSSTGLLPYAPKWPRYLPVAASTITTRRLPYPSDTYRRLLVGSTIRSAGRKKNGVAFLPPSLLLLSAPLV